MIFDRAVDIDWRRNRFEHAALKAFNEDMPDVGNRLPIDAYSETQKCYSQVKSPKIIVK